MNAGVDAGVGRQKLSVTGKIIIGLILVMGVSLQTYHAVTWERGYDEAWNLYYSRIQPFEKSFIEFKHNAHPPLASILLRIPVALGDALFWARLGSIIPSCIFILFVFLILKKLRIADPLPYILAFILAISHTIVNLSVCVRAYTLMSMFISIALYYFIDILRDINAVKSSKIFSFVVCSLLAVWTEYSAGFVIVSLLMSLLIYIVVGRLNVKDIFKKMFKNWYSISLFALGLVGLVRYFSWTIMPIWQGHVSNHYLKPPDTVLSFIRKGIASNIRYFTPFTIDNKWLLICVSICCVLITLFFAFRFLKKNIDAAKASILLSHLFIWGILIITGIRSIYPFGGSMRHQFILFPFLFLSGAIVADECLRWAGKKKILYGASVLLTIGSLYVSITAFSGPPAEEFPASPLFEKAYQGFADLVDQKDAVVYLTSFNHFALFYHMLDWQWNFMGVCRDSCYDIEARKDGKKMRFITDRAEWLPPIPLSESFIVGLSQILTTGNIKRMWVYSVLQGKSLFETYDDQAWDEMSKTFNNRIHILKRHSLGEGYAYLVEAN